MTAAPFEESCVSPCARNSGVGGNLSRAVRSLWPRTAVALAGMLGSPSAVRSAEPGRQAVERAGPMKLTRGVVRALADYASAPEIDLYSPEVIHTGAVRLGRVELTAGKHTLTVTAVDRNPNSHAR